MGGGAADLLLLLPQTVADSVAWHGFTRQPVVGSLGFSRKLPAR